MNKATYLVTTLVAGLVTSSILPAAELPLEVYGRPETVTAMAVSPDGDRIAFRRRDETVDAVFVLDRKSGDIIGVVDGSETNLRRVNFLDEDRLILFADEADHIRLIGRKLQISGSFMYDLRTNKLSKLLDNWRRLYPLQEGVGRIVGHSPERDSVYMPAFVGELNGPPPSYGLFEVTLDQPNGRLLDRGRADTVDWFVDEDGQILAEEEYDSGPDERRIWGRKGNKRVLLYESGPDTASYVVTGLSHDFSSLIVSARTSESDYWMYFEMSLEDGSVGPPLFQKEDASVERALVDNHRRVYGVEYSGFFPRYEFFDAALTERVRSVQASLASTAAYLVDWSPDFRYLLFRITGGWTAGAYVLVSPDSPNPQLLTNTRDDIPRESVAPTSVIDYEAEDGMKIPALVTARADIQLAGKAPLIVLPHGGPASYDRYEFDWLAQYFASRGIVVLQPQFRGSTGFGATLKAAGIGEWGLSMSTDLDDGVKRLIDDGLVDPARVCMVGLSYGGYATLAAGAFSPFDYKCLVAISGVSDLPRMLVTERELTGQDSNAVDYWRWQLGIEGKPGRVLEDISPVNFAENFRAPVLLIHGRSDAVVPLDQSLRMEKSLKRANKDVELVRLQGEDHYLSGYETRLEALRVVADFIDENL